MYFKKRSLVIKNTSFCESELSVTCPDKQFRASPSAETTVSVH